MATVVETNNATQGGVEEQCTGELNTESQFIIASLNILAGIIAMFGNTLVLTAIYRTPSLRTVSNAFVASLAVSDFYIGLVIHTVWMARAILNIWQSDQFLSEMVHILSLQSIIASAYNLCAIAIDRYISIANVFKSQDIITPKRCAITISCIWVFSVAFATTRLFVHDPQILPYLWFSVQFLGILLPLNVIAYCYFRIFKIARQQKKKIAAENFKKRGRDFYSEKQQSSLDSRNNYWTIRYIGNTKLYYCLCTIGINKSMFQNSYDSCLVLDCFHSNIAPQLAIHGSTRCETGIFVVHSHEYLDVLGFLRETCAQIWKTVAAAEAKQIECCWLKCKTCLGRWANILDQTY